MKPRVRSGNKDETEVPGAWAVVTCKLELHLPKSKVLCKSCHQEPQYLKQMGVGEGRTQEPRLHPLRSRCPSQLP